MASVAAGEEKTYDLGRLGITTGHLAACCCSCGSAIWAGCGALERHQLYYVVFAIRAFQLVFSPLWLKYFRFGPFEWRWRSLTYMKAQPLRRTRKAI